METLFDEDEDDNLDFDALFDDERKHPVSFVPDDRRLYHFWVGVRHRQWARKAEFVRNIATLYDIPDVNELPSFGAFDQAS